MNKHSNLPQIPTWRYGAPKIVKARKTVLEARDDLPSVDISKVQVPRTKVPVKIPTTLVWRKGRGKNANLIQPVSNHPTSTQVQMSNALQQQRHGKIMQSLMRNDNRSQKASKMTLESCQTLLSDDFDSLSVPQDLPGSHTTCSETQLRLNRKQNKQGTIKMLSKFVDAGKVTEDMEDKIMKHVVRVKQSMKTQKKPNPTKITEDMEAKVRGHTSKSNQTSVTQVKQRHFVCSHCMVATFMTRTGLSNHEKRCNVAHQIQDQSYFTTEVSFRVLNDYLNCCKQKTIKELNNDD